MSKINYFRSRHLSKKYHCNFKVGKKVKFFISGDSKISLQSSMLGCHGICKDCSVYNLVDSKLVVGESQIYTGCIIDLTNASLNIGNKTWINEKCQFRCRNSITIGDHCAIGFNCLFMDTDFHSLIPDQKQENGIVLGNHVWIGANSTILKNVILGNNVVVAAGSVVTKSFPDNVLIGGVPAKIIKENINWKS